MPRCNIEKKVQTVHKTAQTRAKTLKVKITIINKYKKLDKYI